MSCICDSCGWKGPMAETKPWFESDRFVERMDVGQEVPAGECPQCGAWCYIIKDKKPVTREDVANHIGTINEEALLADGFEAAYVGWAERCSKPALAVYDYEKCVRVLVERDGMSDEEAREFIEFNVTGAWCGENTPLFMTRYDPDDYVE